MHHGEEAAVVRAAAVAVAVPRWKIVNQARLRQLQLEPKFVCLI